MPAIEYQLGEPWFVPVGEKFSYNVVEYEQGIVVFYLLSTHQLQYVFHLFFCYRRAGVFLVLLYFVVFCGSEVEYSVELTTVEVLSINELGY